MAGKLRITLRKSVVSTTQQARGTVRALGLRRIGQTVELPDTPDIRGQARAVRYLLEVEEVGGSDRATRPGSARASAEPASESAEKAGETTE